MKHIHENKVITAHRLREHALVNYATLRRNRTDGVLEFLTEAAEELRRSNPHAIDWAYWLWVVGEFMNTTDEKAFIEQHESLIMEGIERIERTWNEPQSHWLWEEHVGQFLSNLAIYHAALKTINNKFRSEKAQRICKEIREMTFSAFMKGTHFVSREGSAEVWEDIVAAAIPFGLISAGDLALLSAREQLNEDQLQGDMAALMSWYHMECGQSSRAKQLLDLTINTADGAVDSVFLSIIREQVSQQNEASSQAIAFDHSPVGGECPYIFMNNERSPRAVTIGDWVTIKTFTEPLDTQAAVNLEYVIDQEHTNTMVMTLQDNTEEQYWFAEIAPITQLAQVKYRFVTVNGMQSFESDWYSFEVLQWLDIDKVVHVEQAQEKLSIYFDPLFSGSKQLCMELSVGEASAVQYHFATVEPDDVTKRAHAQLDGTYTVGHIAAQIQNSTLQLSLLDDQGMVISTSYNQAEYPLLQTLVDQHGTMYKVRLNYSLNNTERIYGMGERFAQLEFSGSELDNYVFNQYKDQGFKTYMPIPFMISSGGYGLFLHSSLYSVFRFSTVRNDLLQIEADVDKKKQSLSWYMFTGQPLDIIKQFTSVTGKPKLPPKWSFGPWMSSNNWDSEQEVDWQLAQTTKHQIPSTVMVLEQWSDESTFYIWNDAQYVEKPGAERFTYDDFTFPAWGRWPDPRAMVRRVHDQGIRVLMWQAPVMKYMDGIAHAQKDEDERVMIASGYGVRNQDGTPYRIPSYEWFRNSLVPDFTNPSTAEWWLGKRQYLFDEIGVDGFKTDGGECIYGSELQFHDGRTGAEMRNEYPNNYIQAFYKFANEHVSGGAITFSRAGYTGAQNTPMHWAGDEKSTFDAFRSSIVAGLSCGMSGIPFWGWDMGGFSGEIPTAELYIRSIQMAAFCPVMQYHAESKGEFNMDRTPWNIAERTGNPEVLSIYKKFADIRMNLLPYIYEQATISSVTGYPLMRAMLLAFPDDSTCHKLSSQYMFGKSLLVVPITEEGASEVEAYLPEGDWLPLFDKQAVALTGGTTVRCAAALEAIPVFVRADSAIPLNLGLACELGEHVGNATDRYERLTILIFLTKSIDYSFLDDLGNSVHVTATKSDTEIEATIEVAGQYPATLLFRGTGREEHVVTVQPGKHIQIF